MSTLNIEPDPSTLLSISTVETKPLDWHEMLLEKTRKHAFLRLEFRALALLYKEQGALTLEPRLRIELYENHLEGINLFRQAIAAHTPPDSFAVLSFTMAIGIFQIKLDSLQFGFKSAAVALQSFKSCAQLISPTTPLFFDIEKDGYDTSSSLRETLGSRMLEIIANLEESASMLLPEHRETQSLQHAIQSLKVWAVLTGGCPRTWTHFAYWPGSIDQKFIDLLALKHPLAMSVYGLWCTSMSQSPHSWFLKDWSFALMQRN